MLEQCDTDRSLRKYTHHSNLLHRENTCYVSNFLLLCVILIRNFERHFEFLGFIGCLWLLLRLLFRLPRLLTCLFGTHVRLLLLTVLPVAVRPRSLLRPQPRPHGGHPAQLLVREEEGRYVTVVALLQPVDDALPRVEVAGCQQHRQVRHVD